MGTLASALAPTIIDYNALRGLEYATPEYLRAFARILGPYRTLGGYFRAVQAGAWMVDAEELATLSIFLLEDTPIFRHSRSVYRVLTRLVAFHGYRDPSDDSTMAEGWLAPWIDAAPYAIG